MTIAITTTALPNGVVGQYYQFQLQATVNPPSTLTWTCDNDLPPHLVLNASTGILSGLCIRTYLGSLTFWVESNNSGEKAHAVLLLSIGAGWTSVLLRDCLQDTGGTNPPPSTYPFVSPDVICTQNQTVTPSRFTQNYNSDPNLPIITGQNNYFYVRAKNLGSTSGAGGAYLYWCPSSLLLLPTQWAQNALQPSSNIFPQTAGGQIAVTDAPFYWTPSALPNGQQYSLICATSTQSTPWNTSNIPAFSEWLSFVNWVNSALNVCWRNVTIVTNLTQTAYTRLDLLDYPFSESTVMLLQVQVTNVPIGTTVTLKNNTLGINSVEVTIAQNQTIYSTGATCPAAFNGLIETTLQLPNGQNWPTGAQITTTLYFGCDTAESPFPDRDFKTNTDHPHVAHAKRLAAKNGQGTLVPVGNCTTLMQ